MSPEFVSSLQNSPGTDHHSNPWPAPKTKAQRQASNVMNVTTAVIQNRQRSTRIAIDNRVSSVVGTTPSGTLASRIR